MRLQDKVVLVTGGSRGIGAAVCSALAAEGATVAVNYQSNQGRADELVETIRESGGRAVALGADVSDLADVSAMVKRVVDEFGQLDVLVNNAGITKDSLIYNMEPDDWLSVMSVNFGGVFNGTKAVLDVFMAQRSGSIVNISSVMGERGWVGQSNYSASKGAINAFTRSSAVELARFGIRVNAVLPGFSPTELVADLVDKGGKGIKKQLPLREFGEVEEVASVVAFLASPDARYLTGSCITVDGGASAQLGLGRPA